MSDVTRLLTSIEQGKTGAAEELLSVVYEELRKLATQKMMREAPGQTLQATALVHEAWLRLTRKPGVQWGGQDHFFAAAAEAMRRILIENARRKRAVSHGGGQKRVDLVEIEAPQGSNDLELLSINEALEKLAQRDKIKAELVKLRYFVGFTIEEAAAVLHISVPTAKRYWTYAKAWLYHEIQNA